MLRSKYGKIKSGVMRNSKYLNFFRALLFPALASLGLTSCADESRLETPPIVKNISLASEGVVAAFDFEVTRHWVYYFQISFKFPENNQIERSRVRKIIGGHEFDKTNNPTDPGILTPLTLIVYNRNNDPAVVVYKKSITPVLTGWGGNDFTKIIGYCDLPPGKYAISLQSHARPKEYESIPTLFVIGMDKFKVSFDLKNIDRSKTCPQ